MDDKVKERLLYDFYGDLLTEKQREILNYYYNEDYGLSEIGDLIDVTRQGVYDSYKRSKNIMMNYESKLHLLDRHFENKQALIHAIELLRKIKGNLSSSFHGQNDLEALESILIRIEESY